MTERSGEIIMNNTMQNIKKENLSGFLKKGASLVR